MQNNRLIQDVVYVRRGHAWAHTPTPPAPVTIHPSPRPEYSQKPKVRYSILIPLLVLVVGFGMMIINGPISFKGDEGSKASLAAHQEPEETVPEVLPKINSIALQERIDAIIARYPSLQISVSYADIKSSESLNAGVQEPYFAASTSKLLAAVLFLREVEKGKYRLDNTIAGASAESQLKLMIEKSDNATWNALRDLLGHSALQQLANEIGMSNYRSEGNTGSPSDIAVLLEKLYANELLDSGNTKRLLSYMQNASESQYIPTAVPDGSKIYHKAGYLQDRAHDAAIIDNGKQPFVLVIFTKANSGAYNFELGTKIMHELTSAVLAAYPS